MGNLLQLVVALAEDDTARDAFRSDPDAALAGLGDVSAEDVAAVVDVARVQVRPDLAQKLLASLELWYRAGEENHELVRRALLGICDAVER